jgi:hypothetical protein
MMSLRCSVSLFAAEKLFLLCGKLASMRQDGERLSIQCAQINRRGNHTGHGRKYSKDRFLSAILPLVVPMCVAAGASRSLPAASITVLAREPLSRSLPVAR